MITKEDIFNDLLDHLKEAPGVREVEESADSYDDNQKGLSVIGENGEWFTIIIVDEVERD